MLSEFYYPDSESEPEVDERLGSQSATGGTASLPPEVDGVHRQVCRLNYLLPITRLYIEELPEDLPSLPLLRRILRLWSKLDQLLQKDPTISMLYALQQNCNNLRRAIILVLQAWPNKEESEHRIRLRAIVKSLDTFAPVS
jgi:hypothetical protein